MTWPYPSRKLTWEQAQAIRARHAEGRSIRSLAHQHHVDRGVIRKLVRGETYKTERKP